MSSGQVEHQGNERESRGIRSRRSLGAANGHYRPSYAILFLASLPKCSRSRRRSKPSGAIFRPARKARSHFLARPLAQGKSSCGSCAEKGCARTDAERLCRLSFSAIDGRSQPNRPGCVRELLETLAERKRETDLLGYLDRNLVAVLLLSTDKSGAERFAETVKSKAIDFGFSSAIQTYQDDAGNREAPVSEPANTLDPKPAVAEDWHELPRYGYPGKRVLDVIGSIALIVLLLPVFIATALAVKLTSPGPVIFRQTRLGAGGRRFVFYKFRSMRCDSDDRIHKEYVSKLITGQVDAVNQGDANKPVYKMKSDPRITRVGRFIRKTSIDELPQLFNVLKGDMSLVGPRPPLPYEVERYQSWHLMRVLTTKPGMTGLWQVEGRSRTTFDEMVRLDLRYARQCSFGLDLKILLKTVKVVLLCEGAT